MSACASGPQVKPDDVRGSNNNLKFLLQLPYNYNFDSDKRYPLLVFLHGRGERGDDLNKLMMQGTPPFHYDDYPVLNKNFILLSPQLPKTLKYWVPRDLQMVIASIMEKYRVDPSRIYLTGISMGGIGGWELLKSSPDLFAATALFAGVPLKLIKNPGEPKPRFHAGPVRLDKSLAKSGLRSMPFLAIHCDNDRLIPASGSLRMVAALKELGNNRATQIIRKGCGHGAWGKVYRREMPILRKKDIFYWFLQHSK